jgi:hypothetical protein
MSWIFNSSHIGLNPHTADYITRSSYSKIHVNGATAAMSKPVAERLVEDSCVI